MYPRYLFIGLFFLLSYRSAAQQKFQKGSIVLESGDTLHGLINDRDWSRNPKEISFQSELATTHKTYSVSDLKYFEVLGKDVYQKAIVWKDMLPVTVDSLLLEGAERQEKDTVFLRQLMKGPRLTLYELIDQKRHYYIQENQQSPVELQYKVFLEEGSIAKVRTLNTFRDQLKGYFTSPAKPALAQKINNASYTSKDLKQIMLLIDPTATEHGKPLRSSKLFIGAGITQRSLKFFNNSLYTYEHMMVADPHTGYALQLGMNIFSERNFQRSILRPIIIYSAFQYKGVNEGPATFGHTEERKLEVDFKNVYTGISFNYSLSKSNVRPYIGFGGGFNFLLDTKNKYTVTNKTTGEINERQPTYSVDKIGPEISAQVGVYYKSWDASVGRKLIGRPTKAEYNLIGLYLNYTL